MKPGYSDLAGVLRDRRCLDEAETLYRRVLAQRLAALGEGHPDTAVILSNLAGVLAKRGRPSEAEPLYRRALAIDEAALGADHPDTATTLKFVTCM